MYISKPKSRNTQTQSHEREDGYISVSVNVSEFDRYNYKQTGVYLYPSSWPSVESGILWMSEYLVRILWVP